MGIQTVRLIVLFYPPVSGSKVALYRGGRVGLNRDRHGISGSSAGFGIELPIWGIKEGGLSPTGVTPHIGGQVHPAIAMGRLSKYVWSGVRAPRLECGLFAL